MAQKTLGTPIGKDPKYDGEIKGENANVTGTLKVDGVSLLPFTSGATVNTDLADGLLNFRLSGATLHIDLQSGSTINTADLPVS